MGVPPGMQMSGPYPRTTSNSPLPPIPNEANADQRGVNANVVGSGTGLGALNAGSGSRGELGVGGGAYGRTLPGQQQRLGGIGGSPPGAKTRMSYEQGGVGAMAGTGVNGYEQQMHGERKKGFFAMLCCR